MGGGRDVIVESGVNERQSACSLHIVPTKTYKSESSTLICFSISSINLDIIKAQIEACVQEMKRLMHETADS